MKKLSQKLLAITALMITSFAFAATPPTDGYVTSQFHSLTKPSFSSSGSAKSLVGANSFGAIKPTNIFIVNESNYDLHVLVPGADLEVDAGGTGLVTHDTYAGYTKVKITDAKYNQLFEEVNACPRAIFTVSGYPGHFKLDVERKYCQSGPL